jgi:hypothetical protein
MWRALALTAVFALSACTQAVKAPAQSPPSEELRPARTVVDFTGFGEIKVGTPRSDLDRFLNQDLPGCNAQLRSYPQGSLVFSKDDRFVLMWFNEPMATAEGVTTGTPVSRVLESYPGAVEKQAPEGGNRFDGLLVVSGEHGYLFLHDGETVQKAIAGYVDYLHQLFDSGFGVC